MNQHIFVAFRKVAKLFSGHGLRDRFRFIDRVYKKINRRLAPSVVEVLGHSMYLDRDDSMGLALNGVYEPAETELILKLIQPGSVVLDIGVNIGYYTLLFARLVGPTGHVFAFEPDPYSFDLLSKNIRANHYTNVSAFQCAASDHDCELELHRDRFNNLDHRMVAHAEDEEIVAVKAIRLDDFLPTLSDRCVDFVKMDIQGSVGWALEGMKGLVERSSTIQILSEFWPAGLEQAKCGSDQFLCRLMKMGFELMDVGGETAGFASANVQELTTRYAQTLTGHTNLLCRQKCKRDRYP